MIDKLNPKEALTIGLAQLGGMGEKANAEGIYTIQCFDKPNGQLLWEQRVGNVVCTLGKNLMLQSSLTGSAYTTVGPYMGLISSVGFTAVSAADTIASHAGWNEAGTTNAPTFAARVAPAFSTPASGTISTSTPVSFIMTGSGTIQGGFLVYGTGATTTIGSTTGILLSAGVFQGGAQPVITGNEVRVAYQLSL